MAPSRGGAVGGPRALSSVRRAPGDPLCRVTVSRRPQVYIRPIGRALGAEVQRAVRRPFSPYGVRAGVSSLEPGRGQVVAGGAPRVREVATEKESRAGSTGERSRRGGSDGHGLRPSTSPAHPTLTALLTHLWDPRPPPPDTTTKTATMTASKKVCVMTKFRRSGRRRRTGHAECLDVLWGCHRSSGGTWRQERVVLSPMVHPLTLLHHYR